MDEKTSSPKSSKKSLVLIGLGIVFLVIASNVWVASQYETKPVEKKTATSKPIEGTNSSTPGSETPKTEEPKTKVTGTIIRPGESAEVDCGVSNDGIEPRLDDSSNLKYTTIGGEKRTLNVYLVGKDYQRAGGARLKWTFGDWGFGGSLEINGCSATFTPPDSISTAYNAKAPFYIKAVLPTVTPPPKTDSPGESGPIFAGYTLEQSILVYDAKNGGSSGCYNPAGVAISINSVSTYSNVQIVVNTPRYTGRSYNSRIATVRDGVGTYNIYVYVNGSLYDSTTSEVGKCQLSTVKW